MILALDIETTGLDPARDRILEVAAVLLDDNLEEDGYFHKVLYCPFWREIADDFVQEMHGKSGLADAMRYAHPEITNVERELLQFVPDGKPVLLGASVHFDRAFLRHWMPLLESKLSHRHIDTTTLKLVHLGVQWPEHGGTQHRAMDDVLHSIAIARHARAVGVK